MKTHRILTGGIAALLAVCPLSRAAVVTSTWATAASGSWDVNANWTNVPALGGFPNDGNGGVATYDAVINVLGAAYTLTLSTGITIEAFTLSSANATVNQTAGTFTANAGIALSAGTFQMSGGTISNTTINVSGTGSLLIGASTNNMLTGVMVNGDMNLTVTSARTQIAGGTKFTTARLAANAASLGFAPGQTLTGTVSFEGAVAGTRHVEMNGTAGTFTVGPAGIIETNAGLTGDGDIGGSVQFGGAMTLANQGLISSQVSGRTITIVASSLANTGTLSATNGGILTINSASWSNAGTISVNASTVNLGGTFNTTGGIGTWSNTGGTVNVTGTILNTGNTITLNSSTGSWTMNGGTISGGTLGLANGQTLLIASNSGNLLTGVTVNGDLTLNVTSARTQIAGGSTFTTAHLAANAVSLGVAPGQTLTGTVSFEGAVAGTRYVEMNGTAGTFTVGPTGIIQTTAGLTGDGNIGGVQNYGGVMTLANQGLISSQVNGRTTTIVASSLANTGTLSATNGGILTINSASWSNAGTISVNASTVNLGGTFNTTGGIGTWSNTGGTVNVTGTILNTGNTITLNSSTGSWTMNGGTISGGTLGLANGQTLLIASNSGNLLTGVTVNGDLTLNVTSARTQIAGGSTFTTAHLAANAVSLGVAPGQTLTGTVSFEGAVAGTRHVEMNGTAGTFTVGPAGIIETNAGLTGDGDIGGSVQFGGAMTLANQGLISSQVSGRTISIVASSLANTGTLSASNGGILTISPTNQWTNGGTISVNASTVNLGGTFNTTGGIGTWSNTGGTVNVTGTILNTGNTITLNSSTGSWTMNGGTISGGTLGLANGQTLLIASNSGNLLTGVTVNGDLTLNVTSARTQIAGGSTFTTAHLAANAVSLGVAPGQTLTGTVSFEGAVAGTRYVEMNGTAGTFTVGPTGIIQTTAGLTGDGNIGGVQNYGGVMTLANQGLISSQVNGRTTTIVASSLANTGTLSATNGGILTINSASWSNAGTISVNASTVNLGGTFNTTGGIGTWSNTGGTVNVTGTILNTGNTITLNSSTGSWTMNGGTISGGTLGLANGQTLLIASNSGNLLTGVTVNGDLTLNVTSARTQIAGGSTFTTAHLAANAVSLGVAPGQTLTGTVSFEGAVAGTRHVEMNGTAGTFTVGPAGIIETNAGLTGDGDIGGSVQFGGAMTLANQGLISSQVSGRTISIVASSLANTGTLSASNGGILTISPTNQWTNGGTISVNASTVNLGGTFNTTGGIGTWSNTGGTVNVTGTILNTGNTITLNSSTGSWTMNGGTISGGTLGLANGQTLLIASNSGNLLTGVTVNGDLTLNVTSARTQIAGGSTFTTAHLAANASSVGFAPGQTLTGTVSFEGAVAGTRYVEMNGTAGAFTVGPTGIIQTTAGLTGDGNIGGVQNYGGAMTLANQGLISSQVSGRTISIVASSFANTGTIEATNGGFLNRPGGYTQTAGLTRVSGGTITAQTAGVNDTIQIAGGTLQGSGSIVAHVTFTGAGIIDPTTGSAGGLAINGNLTPAANTEFRFALAGTAQATQYDFLSETGSAALTLAGTLKLEFANSFQATVTGANTFTILSSNQTILGAFGNVANGARLNTADGFGSFVVNYGAGSLFGVQNVVLSGFVPIPEPGALLLALAGGATLLLRRPRRRV